MINHSDPYVKVMNKNLAYSFLVPFDFTEKSLHALQYASDIVKKHDGMVHLLHVVDERTPTSDESLTATRGDLIRYAREQQEKLRVNIIPHTITGNIFVSIGEMAKKLGVQLIVMGIHGIKGIQFIIGSFAARVILGSPVPVLLTNGCQQFSDLKHIVLPFEKNLPMDQLVKKSIELGLQFKSTIHLYSRNEDATFWQRVNQGRKIRKTIQTIRKAGLNCQNVVLNANNDNIAESIVEYADNIHADLIMITTQNQHNSKEYVIVETGVKLMEKSRTPLYFLNAS